MRNDLKEQFATLCPSATIKEHPDGDVKVMMRDKLNTTQILNLGLAVAEAKNEGYEAVLKRSGEGMSLYLINTVSEALEA